MSVPLWVHPVAELILVTGLLVVFVLGMRAEREWHVRLAWVCFAGVVAMAAVGLVAHALDGFKGPFVPHGWIGAVAIAVLARQAYLGRMLRQGIEAARAQHKRNARILLLLLALQVLVGMYYASQVM